jgi:hypothetical protein
MANGVRSRMTDTPFLRSLGTAEADAHPLPTYEESLTYQAKLLGLWEQQQRVLGYTEASIALVGHAAIEQPFTRVAPEPPSRRRRARSRRA